MFIPEETIKYISVSVSVYNHLQNTRKQLIQIYTQITYTNIGKLILYKYMVCVIIIIICCVSVVIYGHNNYSA